ncbi:hypothetical protein AIOL_003243 [Candidatus Rhodobacter oscarellae]|uniref:Lipid/polyisoprenoid-binding YceI-like domain-containing protein n=1 Tax=Candidatus Rhodobacter oscarellae TaxID=1675527 RepID=A0A0J9E6G7_9RHOB|nr:hypothetical protein AIOL_003243 [Candidatus Rhodobacter lobularis]
MLRIRDIEMPISMPFALTLEGDTADMTASARIDRRGYKIGEQYSDTDGLGWQVDVAITLSATKGGA